MRLPFLVISCLTFATGLPMALTAEGNSEAAALVAMSAIPPTGATAAVIKDANVRFGPNTLAHIVVMLKAGDTVELVNRAPVPGWWAIRFPRSGRAWIDVKNLVAEGDSGLWRVTREGTRAREDATLGAAIVRELAKGEIVEDRGGQVGSWRAVYIPNAVAYISEKLIELAPQAEGRIADVQQSNVQADQEWQQAAALYLALFQEIRADASRAPRIDWAPLLARLNLVIGGHPNLKVRNQALLIKNAVAEVQRAAAGLGNAVVPAGPVAPRPGTPVVELPGAPNPPTNPANPGQGNPGQGNPGQANPGQRQPTAEELAELVRPRATYTGRGILETKDYSKLGVTHHLVGTDGKVVALVRPAAGSTVAFSEFAWRDVGALGTSTIAKAEDTGLVRDVPLIDVTSLVLP